MTKRRILVPVDFSAQSDAALLYARNMAKSMNALLTCMYVIEDHLKMTGLLTSQEIKHKIRREAEQKLSERVHSIIRKEDHIDFEIIITSGKASQKILEKARDLHVNLIILGKANIVGQDYKSISSSLKKLIAKSHVPVIIVSNRKTTERKNIILPLELLKPIEAQIKCAIDIALSTHASILVISVVESGMPSLLPALRSRLKEIMVLLKDLKIPCYGQLLVKRTTVSKEILSLSKWIDSGFILLATRNESDHSGQYPGSIVKEIIAQSEVPVQCINPETYASMSMEGTDIIIQTNPLADFILSGHLISDES